MQVVCIFRGRQRAHPEMGYRVMKTVAEILDDVAVVAAQPIMSGPRMGMLLGPR